MDLDMNQVARVNATADQLKQHAKDITVSLSNLGYGPPVILSAIDERIKSNRPFDHYLAVLSLVGYHSIMESMLETLKESE